MKLRKLLSKEVDYFGIKLTVPSDVMCIATDSGGLVYGYYNKPKLTDSYWNVSDMYDHVVSLATVELEGTDWRKTLRFV
jgi:hypothetical protein